MSLQCFLNSLISNFLYDIVSTVPMDVQVALNNTNVCDVELDMLFGGMRSCLMRSTRLLTVLVVAGFIIRGAEKIFNGENCDGKGDEDVEL